MPLGLHAPTAVMSSVGLTLDVTTPFTGHAGFYMVGLARKLTVVAEQPIWTGGDGEIRTHGGVTPSAVFKTAALDRSATSPCWLPNFSRQSRLPGDLRLRAAYLDQLAPTPIDTHCRERPSPDAAGVQRKQFGACRSGPVWTSGRRRSACRRSAGRAREPGHEARRRLAGAVLGLEFERPFGIAEANPRQRIDDEAERSAPTRHGFQRVGVSPYIARRKSLRALPRSAASTSAASASVASRSHCGATPA